MLTEAQKQFFEDNGYLVLENVLPPDLLAELQSAARALADADPAETNRVWHERALFRRPAFRKVLDVTPLIEAERDLLGEDVQLLALDLLLTRAHRGQIGWHRDVGFACSKTLSINTGLYLQDMTEEVGLLRVVPGTHRGDAHPPAGPDLPGAITVPAKAGDAVLFDAAVWHTGDANRSNADRLGLFVYFGKYWIKRMDNHFTQALPADLLHTTDPMKRQLLGLGLRPGVASYHGDDESYNRRGEPGIDFPAEG